MKVLRVSIWISGVTALYAYVLLGLWGIGGTIFFSIIPPMPLWVGRIGLVVFAVAGAIWLVLLLIEKCLTRKGVL